MKRRALIGLLFVVVVALGAGGWWYAQREAEREVRRAMIEADLIGRISYSGVSYNPLTGTATLRDIRPVGDQVPGKPTADAFQIVDWEQEGDLVTRTHIKIINFRIDVLEAARSENRVVPAVDSRDSPLKIFERPLQALIVLGYPHLVADAEVDFRYDLDKASMEYAVSLDVERMGKASLELALAGVKPNLVRAVREIGSQASMENPVAALAALGALSALKKDLEQISLAAFGLSYDESGLVRRLKQYHDIHTLRLPSEPSQLELGNEDIERVATLALHWVCRRTRSARVHRR